MEVGWNRLTVKSEGFVDRLDACGQAHLRAGLKCGEAQLHSIACLLANRPAGAHDARPRHASVEHGTPPYGAAQGLGDL